MFKSIKRLVLIATVLAGAIIPSVASARPDGPEQPYSDAAAAVQAVAPAPAGPAATTSMTGFSWHDAAFGAAGMLMLIGLGTGATVAVRRRATRPVVS
jgi:hypothetical protein